MANISHGFTTSNPSIDSNAPHFPGPPGFHMPGKPLVDKEALEELTKQHEAKEIKVTQDKVHEELKKIRTGAQEVRNLNQYTGYFATNEGDFPVSVVAGDIIEAAKILRMPGVFGEGTSEPNIIKFIKGKIAVSVPVSRTGFNVIIDPEGAEHSGAYATPAHAEVKNGTEVIFTAFEPFGWKFVGWYKGDQLLSTEKSTTIEVYDAYSTLLTYTAKYEFNPVLRNGRYLELGHGWYFDFKFDGWGNYAGKMTMYMNYSSGPRSEIPHRSELESRKDWHPMADHHFVIDSYDTANGQLVLVADKSIVQDSEMGMTIQITPTPIGFNMTVLNVTIDNPFGLVEDMNIALKWMGDHDRTYG